MRYATRIFTLTAVLLSVAAHDAVAQRIQQRTTTTVRRGWLGFSYDAVTTRMNGETRQIIEVVDVVNGSPAERAGLQIGDTIVSINDLRISDTFMQSLSYSVAPGDNVRLRIRRNGGERQLAVTAAERPAAFPAPRGDVFTYELSADSIRSRMNLYFDSARIALDSMHFPRLRVERLPEGVWVYSDTSRFRVLTDSSFAWSGGVGGRTLWSFPPDSLAFRVFTEFPRGGTLMRPDSLNRLFLDSMRVQLRSAPRGRIYGFGGDSLMEFSARPLTGGVSVFGMRAVGGAELTDLNPGLGEYFGTDQGVLVVRVPDDTPADRAGLESGDVIVRANGEAIGSVTELRQAIARAGRSSIRLEILRKKARRTIELRDN